MTPAQRALFTEYEDLKRTIKELEEKCDYIKPQLITLIPPDSTVDTGTGTFTLSSRKTWKYSAETTAKEAELKAVEGEPFIVFKEKKA
jgi:hypothetical protein